MKPPADLPLELVLLAEAFARRLQMPVGDFWAVLYRKKPAPPGWAAAWAEAFSPLADVLTSDNTDSTIADVDAISPNALRSWAKMSGDSRRHPFVRVLAKKGITLAEAAEAIGEVVGRKIPRSTVQAWPKKHGDPSYRAIPKDAADAIQALYGVPLSAWRRVIPGP